MLFFRPLNTYYITTISATINMAIQVMQKLPILARIVCKWPISACEPPTSLAARPKNVLRPVPMTIIEKDALTN